MEITIVVCLLVIIFLLWKNNDKVILSSSNDWLVLLWENEGKINIEFSPIIGWRYRKSIQSMGHYEPVTPFYGKKYRTDENFNKFKIISYYWFRDGKQYDYTDDIRSFNQNFWEDLNENVKSNVKIKLLSNIPDIFKDKYDNIVSKNGIPPEFQT